MKNNPLFWILIAVIVGALGFSYYQNSIADAAHQKSQEQEKITKEKEAAYNALKTSTDEEIRLSKERVAELEQSNSAKDLQIANYQQQVAKLTGEIVQIRQDYDEKIASLEDKDGDQLTASIEADLRLMFPEKFQESEVPEIYYVGLGGYGANRQGVELFAEVIARLQEERAVEEKQNERLDALTEQVRLLTEQGNDLVAAMNELKKENENLQIQIVSLTELKDSQARELKLKDAEIKALRGGSFWRKTGNILIGVAIGGVITAILM